jgi:hypothetical protein
VRVLSMQSFILFEELTFRVPISIQPFKEV